MAMNQNILAIVNYCMVGCYMMIELNLNQYIISLHYFHKFQQHDTIDLNLYC